jgi:hypothetical protein
MKIIFLLLSYSFFGSAGVPPGTPLPEYTSTFSHSGNFKEICLSRGRYASVKMPVPNANEFAEIVAFQSTATPSDLNAQVVISTAQGDFIGLAPNCQSQGSAWSSIDIMMFTSGSNPQYCQLQVGQTYYANYRHVNADLSPSCQDASCCARLQYFGGKQ